MKKIIIVVIAVLALLACGGSGGGDPVEEPVIVEGKTFRQTVTLPAAQADTVVTLTDLKAAVGSIDGGEAWLTVTRQPYTSGSPSVRLVATVNEAEVPRSCVATITAASADKVLLTVTQQKAEPKEQDPQDTGIDDVHDVVTDQPAAVRQW